MCEACWGSEAYESFGRVKTRPCAILKVDVAVFGGELVDRATGIVLTSDEAYETVHAPVREEALGSVPHVDPHGRRFRHLRIPLAVLV